VTRHHSPDATTPSNPVPTTAQRLPPQLLAPVPVAIVAIAQPPRPPQPLQPPRREQSESRPVEDTLKPSSDRRFFLPQDQSPSPERGDGHDRGSNGSISTGKSPSETGELQPSSVTSNQTRASQASTGRGRRSKNAPTRPTLTRLNSGRHVVQITRKEPAKVRAAAAPAPALPALNKVAGASRQQRSPIEAKATNVNGAATVAPPPKAVTANTTTTTNGGGGGAAAAAGGAPRRGIVVSNSSSDYETTDTEEDDDDSWASEDISEGAADKRAPTKEETRLREAAVEAQRQRQLFVKQPKRSYSNLGRTQSGLLSQLLNPDPTSFQPPGRPYRISSSGGIPSAFTSGKSSAALPQAAQITAQAPIATSSGGGGYRPKGRPQGEELEDESDSPDDPDDTIQVSHSLAHQRLAALASNPAAAGGGRRRASDNSVQLPQPPLTTTMTMTRPILPTVATAPIPLNHPWNLPAPAPPTTPRTTRRQMLATELSESLRRNLLWERQVSKTNLLGNAGKQRGVVGLRTAALNGNAQQQQQQQQPPRQQPSQQQPQQQQPQQPQQQPQGGSAGNVEGGAVAAEDNLAERRRRALARNRTWDDFHYSGW